MSAILCPLIKDCYTESATANLFFDDKERDILAGFVPREKRDAQCETNLFFGFFFDGTKNNYIQGAKNNNQSNVARLYDCFPGLSVDGVLPTDSAWAGAKKNYFRVYIPGVASPFMQVRDSGEKKDLDRGAAFGTLGEARIIWALLQAINNVHLFFHTSLLISSDEALSLINSIELTKWQRSQMSIDRMETFDDSSNRKRLARHIFQDILIRLRDRVSIHWFDEKNREAGKTDPAQLKTIYISAFGFSRGSAEARVFANWLMSLCELDARICKRPGGRTLGGFQINFDFLGLFDTVASVGVANTLGDSWLFSGFDGHGGWADAEDSLRIHADIIKCVHLVSAHEVRRSFPLDSISVLHDTPANSEEVVFPGVHSDLGSGYCPQEQGRGADPAGSDMLARIPLLYMYKEARLAGVPLKLDDASPAVQKKFKVVPSVIKALNDYLCTCQVKKGSLTDIMREQGKKQILWHLARRVNGPSPLEKTDSYSRASTFDKNDLHSANVEFEVEIKDFEEWLAGKGGKFSPKNQGAGFGNSYENEWEEIATWWNKAEPLPASTLSFFDNYVHDSHAWFKLDEDFPDSEEKLKKEMVIWEQKRLAAIAELNTMHASNGRGIERPQSIEGITRLSTEQLRVAAEYAKTGKIPEMLTSGRETKTFMTFTVRGGYLRYRKVYAGADNLLISDNVRHSEPNAIAA